ncbi:hypothetical protein PY479_01185 [Shewanella sp. A32]|uniref:hypothetical protein n=1 Tax=Shewanella sp. A32 TaxID=3031327 RepID=UPI0023B8F54A|nr:hypothetical protein [Shewanella sp. A32]MDF0532887.1 hypothetical protein [Shewanella sp. A32]
MQLLGSVQEFARINALASYRPQRGLPLNFPAAPEVRDESSAANVSLSQLHHRERALRKVQRWSQPQRADEPIGQAFKVAELRKEVGIPFVIDLSDDGDSRNLPSAAQAVSRGFNTGSSPKSHNRRCELVGATGHDAMTEGYDVSLVVSDG